MKNDLPTQGSILHHKMINNLQSRIQHQNLNGITTEV